MKSFWQKISKPIMALAPMEDVTDTVFRRVIGSLAPPDVYFTEFTNVDGLFSKGREQVIHRFAYTENERPIVAQIWGNSPELFYKAVKLIVSLKFDGVDINMGCPEKNVIQHKAGAACMLDRIRAGEIIAAAKEGSRSASRQIPVSVKTRLGYKKISPEWISFLLEQNPDAIEIHGRTAAELSKVPAHWDEIAKAVTLKNQMGKDTIILGNGDVSDYTDAVKKCNVYGTDGVMIGRGIFHNLWAFDKTGVTHMDSRKELFRIMREHIALFDTVWGTKKNFSILKKFFKIYIHNVPHAGEVRERLMLTGSRKEAEGIIDAYERTYP